MYLDGGDDVSGQRGDRRGSSETPIITEKKKIYIYGCT